MSSTVAAPPLPEPVLPLVQSVQAVIPLLKEYVEKLRELSKDATTAANNYWQDGPNERKSLYRNEVQGLKKRFAYLRPAALALSRYVSPIVEHGKLDDSTRLELRLRLAEFEGILLSMVDEFGHIDAKMK